MARHFSEHFAAVSDATTAPPIAYADPPIKAPPGKNHAKTYRKVIHMDFTVATAAAAEEVRLARFKSGDRIMDLRYSTNAAWAAAAYTMDVGLYAVGEDGAGDGAVLDENLYGDDLDLAATIANADAFKDGVLLDHHRGLPMWEQLAVGAGTDTSDPLVMYDLVMTFETITTQTANGIVQFDVEYLPAGVS